MTLDLHRPPADSAAIMLSHKTKGTMQAYLPDPSEVESFDTILRDTKPSKPKGRRGKQA